MSFAEAAAQLQLALDRAEEAVSAVRGARELAEQAVVVTQAAKDRVNEVLGAIGGASQLVADLHDLVAAVYDGVDAGNELLNQVDQMARELQEEATNAAGVMQLNQDDAVASGHSMMGVLDSAIIGSGMTIMEMIQNAIARANAGKA